MKGSKFYLIMEYCEKGDLADYLKRLGLNMDVPEWRVWKFIIQLCLALEHIHSQGIIHSDLKPQNILLSGKDYDIRLADFGISQVLTKNYFFVHSFVGTLYYCSPEVCKGKPFNQKTDVWALGCILYEICTKRKAFDGVSDENLKSKIISFNHPVLPSKYSLDIAQIYNMCMQKDQEARPTISQILQMATVQEQAQKLNILIHHVQTIPKSLVSQEYMVFSKQYKRNNNQHLLSSHINDYLVECSIDSIDNNSIDSKKPLKFNEKSINNNKAERRQNLIKNVQQLYFSKRQQNQEFYKDLLSKGIKNKDTDRVSPLKYPGSAQFPSQFKDQRLISTIQEVEQEKRFKEKSQRIESKHLQKQVKSQNVQKIILDKYNHLKSRQNGQVAARQLGSQQSNYETPRYQFFNLSQPNHEENDKKFMEIQQNSSQMLNQHNKPNIILPDLAKNIQAQAKRASLDKDSPFLKQALRYQAKQSGVNTESNSPVNSKRLNSVNSVNRLLQH